MNGSQDIKIRQWIDKLQSHGKYAFSLDLLEKELPNYTAVGIKRALNRLSRKGLVVSISKGYYLIISPQYASKGVLPPSIYLDAFMKYLERPYYLGLLNAAAYHGAAHQQPQEFFVVTSLPVLRATHKKGLKVNYISKKSISEDLLSVRKTESGYLKISNPVLTAIDLLNYEKRIGGINRVATVLNELAVSIKPEDFTEILIDHATVSTLQRLGYLLGRVLGYDLLADALQQSLQRDKVKLFRTPLKVSAQSSGYSSDKTWKVIVNTEIEIDE